MCAQVCQKKALLQVLLEFINTVKLFSREDGTNTFSYQSSNHCVSVSGELTGLPEDSPGLPDSDSDERQGAEPSGGWPGPLLWTARPLCLPGA